MVKSTPINARENRHRIKTAARQPTAGFSLLEVLIAMLLAMIGLMGSVAIQQTVLNASQNSNDGQIAMRIASQTLEELNTRVTLWASPQPVDFLQAIADGTFHGYPNRASTHEYVDAMGNAQAEQDPAHRFLRRARVVNRGVGLPYEITVEVHWNLDSGTPKITRLDEERRKFW